MEFKPQDSSLQAARAAVHQALAGRQKLLCFGDRLALISIAYLDAIADGLKAACTTADEALALLRQNAVDVVLVTEDLEQGYGIDLVRQVRQLQPDCLCMLFLRRETQVVVREALDAGAHAVMFVSSLGTGRGDFMQALTSMADGGIYVPEDIRRAAAFTHADGQRDSHLLEHLSTRELSMRNRRGPSRSRMARLARPRGREGIPRNPVPKAYGWNGENGCKTKMLNYLYDYMKENICDMENFANEKASFGADDTTSASTQHNRWTLNVPSDMFTEITSNVYNKIETEL